MGDLASGTPVPRRRAAAPRLAVASLVVAVVSCSTPEQPTPAAFTAVAEPLVATFEAKILPSDGGPNRGFGEAVAFDGTTLVVGVPSYDNLGRAFVFNATSMGFAEQTVLVPPPGTRDFGAAVAVDGDTIVVGAPDVDATDPGEVFVYRRTSGTWSQEAYLTSQGLPDGAVFGAAVDIDGDRVAVGAPHAETGQLNDDGKAYVFLRSGTSWTQEDELGVNAVLMGQDWFGRSVALDGDTLVVGAAGPSLSGPFGTVYVFNRSGSSWNEAAVLSQSSPFGGCFLGWAVDIEGSVLAAGCPVPDGNGSSTRVYELEGASWNLVETLTFQGSGNRTFGTALALSGDTLWVGNERADVAAQNAGALSVYTRTSVGDWSLLDVYTTPDADGEDYFTVSLAAFGNTAVAGTPEDDDDGAGAGAVWAIVLKGDLGDACSAAGDCASGYCVDGVCCESECGGGAIDDCQACSVATGASSDGTCASLSGTSCEDGDLCTQSGTCESGVCEGSDPVQCAPPGECQEPGICDSSTGVCSYPASPDGTDCVGGGTCEGGACVLPDGGTAGTGGAAGAGGAAGSAGSSGSSGSGPSGGSGGDAGTGGDGGTGGTAGSGGMAGTPDAGSNAIDDPDVETSGFYACATGPAPREGTGLLVLLGMIAAAVTRRRAARR